MLDEAFQRMFASFGPQHWWPGESQLEIIVGTVLTQSTNWRNVERAIDNLRAADVLQLRKLCHLDLEKLAELIRPAGFFRLKAKRLQNLVRFIDDRFGSIQRMFQSDLAELRGTLLEVNGIGPETADSILLYAGEYTTFVIDAYTARIAKRHGWIEPEADYQALKTFFESGLSPDMQLFNEYHALIVMTGKQYCKPTPQCEGCPLQSMLQESGPVDWRT